MPEVTKDQRYLVDITVLDTFTEVEHDGGMEPKVVGTGKMLVSSEDDLDVCLCADVRETIHHYQVNHLDEDGDYSA